MKGIKRNDEVVKAQKLYGDAKMEKGVLMVPRFSDVQIQARVSSLDLSKEEASKVTEAFKKVWCTVAERQLEDELFAHEAEFKQYVIEKVKAQGKQGFFYSCYKRILLDGKPLSEKMAEALRKCIEKDAQPKEPIKPISEQMTEEEKKKLPLVKIKVAQWFAREHKLESRIVSVRILRETEKAYYIEGHADMVEDASWCMRCGRPLTQPASYTLGMGEECASQMGVPYPSKLNEMTAKEKKAYRKKVLGVLKKQKFSAWIPKTSVKEEYNK